MTHPTYFSFDDLHLDDLIQVCAEETSAADYPLSMNVAKNIVIYDGDKLHGMVGTAEEKLLKAELAHCLKNGPGVFVIKDAYQDTSIIDEATDIFREIVQKEREAGGGEGDHFGNNERIWNAIQKTAVIAPENFIHYYGNPLLGIACEAWLGPHFQISAQMNNVKPDGAAQSAHRDYHLGFQSRATIAEFPAHAQMMSQYLTLQGAIAHIDMTLEHGPTLFLPHSHKYPAGYMAFRFPEFAQYFADNHVQLPLNKGDMVFFSPALLHGGGNNRTDDDRIANLVQVSSAFGRTMETINNRAMIESVYPVLADGNFADRVVQDTVAAVADGYAFPTNLDSDPPVGGNAPETQQQMILRGLEAGWSMDTLDEMLTAYDNRRLA